MKDKDINIFDYDKIVFVDASGDDGFSFHETSGNGSSFTFVVSCLAIDPNDFEYDCNILEQIKTALHLPIDAELKSTTLKRHRFSSDAYSHLQNVKGDVFSFIVFKKAIQKSNDENLRALCDTSTKQLSGLTHSFPLYALTKTHIIREGQKVLVVIDHMKKSETESISKNYHLFGIDSLINSRIIYRDSKSKQFPLIQLADAIAGSVRAYFEKNLITTPIQRFCQLCGRDKDGCSKGMALKAWRNLSFTNNERIIMSLHRNRVAHDRIMVTSITTLPLNFYKRYLYLDCFFSGKYKKKKLNLSSQVFQRLYTLPRIRNVQFL